MPDFEVPPDYDGQRLDRFLVSVLGDLSRSQIQKLIADGHVTIASPARRSAIKPNAVLHEGNLVSVEIPEPAAPGVRGESIPIDILYQDADVAVLDKPPGMVVHLSAGHDSGTLVNALLHHLGDLSGVGG